MLDKDLLVNQAVTGGWHAVTAGYYNWITYGVWGGATITRQYTPDLNKVGGAPIQTYGTQTANDDDSIDVPIGVGHVRVLVTGATGSTVLSSKLMAVA